MTKVFIGGSRHAPRLAAQVRGRLDNIVRKGFPIVIGDANGADKAVQQYLHQVHYRNVEVFCSDGICRNNVGNWKTRNIPVGTRRRDARFYSVKDRAMAEEATFGLMIWDGKSVGTLLNVHRLLARRKKSVIYIVSEKRFLEFRNELDWEEFLTSRDDRLRHSVEQRATLESMSKSQPHQASLLG